MRKALIDKRFWEVTQIVASEDDIFETTDDFKWVDCPDPKVEDAWFYHDEDGTFEDPHATNRDEFGNPVEPFVMQRMRSYPPVGDQLDMLYKEIAATGGISTKGEWFQSIKFVKDNVPRPGSSGDPGMTPTKLNPYRQDDTQG
jgi:hypothetical protein